MAAVFELRNTIQPYAWGTTDALSDLFGIPNPEQRPQAEIWMGAHPKAPSMVLTDSGDRPLDQFLAASEAQIYARQGAFDEAYAALQRFENGLHLAWMMVEQVCLARASSGDIQSFVFQALLHVGGL